jgi:hypothetical protein
VKGAIVWGRRDVGAGSLGGIGGLGTQKEGNARSASSVGLGYAGGVGVYVKAHITGVVADSGIGLVDVWISKFVRIMD